MEYKVKPEEDGRKVRDILRGSMGVSYTALKSAKWNGRIFLNGETVRADAKASAGDTVEIEWAEDAPVYTLKPFDMPVVVPWEDEHLLIAVKPAGIASQSSRNHPDDSLENAVYARFGCPENFIYRPVNRLDAPCAASAAETAAYARLPAAVPGLDGRKASKRRRCAGFSDCKSAGRDGEADRERRGETVPDKVPGAAGTGRRSAGSAGAGDGEDPSDPGASEPYRLPGERRFFIRNGTAGSVPGMFRPAQRPAGGPASGHREDDPGDEPAGMGKGCGSFCSFTGL